MSLMTMDQLEYMNKHMELPRDLGNDVFVALAIGQSETPTNPVKDYHAKFDEHREAFEDHENYIPLKALKFPTKDAAKFGHVFSICKAHAVKTPLGAQHVVQNGIKEEGDHVVKTFTNMIWAVEQAGLHDDGRQVVVWHEYVRDAFEGDYIMAKHKQASRRKSKVRAITSKVAVKGKGMRANGKGLADIRSQLDDLQKRVCKLEETVRKKK